MKKSFDGKLLVRIKKIVEEAVVPKYAKPGDAGMDLTAIDDGVDTFPEDPARAFYYREYRTGLAVEIPEGYVGLLFPRSSASNFALTQANCVGVIDSGYRGEIKFRFRMDGVASVLNGLKGAKAYQKGDRIGQLIVIPYPSIELQEVAELPDSARGDSGFGSSGA
jgi:dUTP pyrophosphatase